MPRRQLGVKLPSSNGGGRHHGTATSSPSPLVGEGRGGGSCRGALSCSAPQPPPPTPPHKGEGRRRWARKKGRHAWRPVREIAREEIANLSSFVVAAPPMVQRAPVS